MRVITFFMSAALGCSANGVMNAQESRKALVDSITPARESSPDTTLDERDAHGCGGER